MEKECNVCGTKLEEDEAKCPECGAPQHNDEFMEVEDEFDENLD